MEYRPISEERMDEFRSFLDYAFQPESGPPDTDEEEPPAGIGDPGGLFDDGHLLTVCRHYWFEARVRGDRHPLAGLASIATPPEHRRRGYVRRLIRASLAEYRERGSYLAALWPFDHPFYARFGWAVANTYAEHECTPEALRVGRDRDGSFVRLDPDDHDRMADVLSAHGEPYELTVDRSDEWWRRRVFEGWQTDPYVYGWERDGDLRGYLVYRIEDGDEGRSLRVDELVYADYDARLACLEFLANHDSQVERVRLYGPPETTLLDVVEDPCEVETEITAGPMVRVVDVRAALEALAYPADVEETVVLAVEDPIVDSNDATFEIEGADGSATVGPSDATPDAAVGIGTLSQLYVGYRSVETLERVGKLSIDGHEARAALDRAFPPRDVFLREGF